MDRVICVEHREGDLFDIDIRGHHLQADQPMADGGTDRAPTPTELFVAGLASCIAFYARRFLARHGLPDDELRVEAAYAMAERPARVGQVKLSIRVPDGVPAERWAALLAVASHCTVHNSLVQPPEISIELTGR